MRRRLEQGPVAKRPNHVRYFFFRMAIHCLFSLTRSDDCPPRPISPGVRVGQSTPKTTSFDRAVWIESPSSTSAAWLRCRATIGLRRIGLRRRDGDIELYSMNVTGPTSAAHESSGPRRRTLVLSGWEQIVFKSRDCRPRAGRLPDLRRTSCAGRHARDFRPGRDGRN